MRLLYWDEQHELSLTENLDPPFPPYAILSHTWYEDNNLEVTLADFKNNQARAKAGYVKLNFCGRQAVKDKIAYFWVDTCCIDKTNAVELSEAIASMFRWYRDAVKCYVYLSDVSTASWSNGDQTRQMWEADFRNSRWFRRGWTLQELLAPRTVQFFSKEEEYIDDRQSLAHLIYEITNIPIDALRGTPVSHFAEDERMQWAAKRQTKKLEDQAYCLMGIFEIFIPLIYGEGDNAFRRLQDEIAKRSGKGLGDSAHVHWIVPRSTNPLFQGRDELLQQLEGLIRDAVRNTLARKQCRIVIHGMGGQGKSEVCLQLACRVRSIFGAIIWVDVSSPDAARRSFLHAAQKLGLFAQSWEDTRLEIANLKYPWLLVLDNADDLEEDYLEYFPDGLQGVVLLTTRNIECATYGTTTSVALDALSADDARKLLFDAASVPQDQQHSQRHHANEVVRLLTSHTLALIQAGAFISRGHCDLAAYPQVYQRQQQQLLRFKPRQARSRYGDIYTTFEASAEALQASNTEAAQDALTLLPLLAACAPLRLPISVFHAAWDSARSIPPEVLDFAEDDQVILLTPWHRARLPTWIDITDNTWNAFRLMEAVSVLKSLSLLRVEQDGTDIFVSMHTLVHAWSRDRQTTDAQHVHWVQMACTMAFASHNNAWWQQQQKQIQVHVEAISSWTSHVMVGTEPAKLVARVLMRLGLRLLEMRSHAKLYAMLENLFTRLKVAKDVVTLEWLGLCELRSDNLRHHGQVKEATALLEQVVRIREQSQAIDHPSRLASQYRLAGVYEANGQVKEAVALLQQVVKIQEQSLAVNHPDQLTSQYALAGAYQANGQVKEAVALLQQVVGIREQSLAVNHPDRLASQHALAGAYRANGQVKEAVALLQQVVKSQEQSLAVDHPDRLASQHELAGAYQANGQVKKAVALLQQVVKIHEQSLAVDHPSRLVSQHTLAGAYQANGQVKEAVALLQQVVGIREQSLAVNHPDRLASQHALAGAYRANGQVKEAVALLQQVVKSQEQSLAVDHPDRLASQHELAGAYQANGQVKEAVALLQQVVKIREQSLAVNHPSRLRSQHMLAGAYRANGQVKEAVALLQQVVKIQVQSLAVDHPDRLTSEHALAVAYQASGQVKEAVALLQQVVKIRKQSLAVDHPDRLVSQHALAGAYRANGQVKKAVALLQQVVKIREQSLAVDHPSRLASQHALAQAYRANGQVQEAVALLEQVVEIQVQSLAVDHPDRLASKHNLATYLWQAGKVQAALNMMANVVEICRRTMDAGHPLLQSAEAILLLFQQDAEEI